MNTPRWILTLGLPLLGAHAQASPAVDWAKQGLRDGRVATAVVTEIDGKAVRHHAIGTVDGKAPDARTRFQFGSITKAFTNLQLAEMTHQDLVKPDQTLASVLPKTFEPKNAAVPKIALAALATHTSGLPRLPVNLDPSGDDPYADYDAEDLVAGLARSRELQPLGRFYGYSNFGAGVLGHALGTLDGRGYRVALRERVIVPLGLEDTGFEAGEGAARASVSGKTIDPWTFDALAGAGALWGSGADLAKLVKAYLGAHEHRLSHPLARDLEVVAAAGPYDVTRVWHVAYDGAAPIYWHNGGTAGFHSFVGLRPDTRKGLAVLVAGDVDPTAMALEALGAKPRAAKPASIDRALLGQYRLVPGFELGVFERDGLLLTQATGQQALVLHRVDENHYALGEVDASLRFERREGEVVAVTLLQNGRAQRAERIAMTAQADRRNEIEIPAAELGGYVGRYTLAPGAVLEVRRREGGLEAMLTGQPWFPVYASARDRFFYRVVDAELVFERDDEGRVVALTLHQGGIVQRAPREE